LTAIVSSDEGGHWASLTGFPDIGNISWMGVSGALYLFGDKGFVLSSDGVNWGSVIPNPYCQGPFDTATKGALVVCNTNTQIFRSVDHGSTWNPLSIAPLPPSGCPSTEPITVSGDVLIKNCFETLSIQGQVKVFPHLFRSGDLGKTWEETSPNYELEIFGPIILGRQNLYMTAHPAGFASNFEVFISKDHGLTWSVRYIPDSFVAYPSMVELADSRICLPSVAPSGGLYCSGDTGISWQWLIKGLTTRPSAGYSYAYPALTPMSYSNGLFTTVYSMGPPAGISLWEFQQQ
jgi:photosystem II stability/assembly factor-like uncharacterized protein